MLEDRLSNTYSQHTISSYPRPQRAYGRPSKMYPVLGPGAPESSGAAESYYMGNAPPVQNNGMMSNSNRASEYHSGAVQAHSQSPVVYPDNRATANPGYISTPTPEQPYQQVNGYPPQPAHMLPYPQSPQAQSEYDPSQWRGNAPPQAPQPLPQQSPSADPDASFYYHNNPQTPQAPAAQTPLQSQRQEAPKPQRAPSYQYEQGPPQNFNPQPYPAPTYQAPPQTQAPPGAAAQPAQQQAAASSLQYPTLGGGYTQDSFPSAPHHQPQAKVMEESLIEL